MARTYKRDARGRFASGGTSKPGRTSGGTLGARTSLRKSRGKLAAKDRADDSLSGTLSRRAQKGAVTRGEKRLNQARKASMVKLGGVKRSGTIARPARFQARPVSPSRLKMSDQQGVLGKVAQRRSMRRIAARAYEDAMSRGVIKRPHRNQTIKAGRVRGAVKMREGQKTRHYVMAAGQRKAARAQSRAMQTTARRGNNIRTYRPNTTEGKMDQIDRQIDRAMKPLADDLRNIASRAKAAKPEIDQMRRSLERMNARAIANRHKKGIYGEVARIELSAVGTGPGKKAISRRMQRAMTAAARGSGPGKRAVGVYLNQLASMGPGKPSKGKNNLRTGPRNTKGPPKRRRKGKS